MAADPRVTARALYEDLTTDARPGLGKIRVPVTVLYAWNDQRPSRNRADQLFRAQYAAVPKVSFVGVGPSAHFVMLDQPAQFQQAVDTFLQD